MRDKHDPAVLPPRRTNLLRCKLVFVKQVMTKTTTLSPRQTRRIALALGATLALGACSSVAVDETTFFADPARYDLYDCKQLGDVRTQHMARVDELKRLMAKAETGTGGAVVSELAYRSEY